MALLFSLPIINAIALGCALQHSVKYWSNNAEGFFFRFLVSSYSKCDGFIQDFKEGKLQTQPGCSQDDTLEVRYCFIYIFMREEMKNTKTTL